MSIKRFIPPLSVRGTGSGSLRLLLVLASCSKDETFNTGECVILPEGCKKIDVDFLAPWLADNKLAKRSINIEKKNLCPKRQNLKSFLK